MSPPQIRVVAPAQAPQQRWEKRKGYGVTRCTTSTPEPNANANAKTRKKSKQKCSPTHKKSGRNRILQGGRAAKKHQWCSQPWLTQCHLRQEKAGTGLQRLLRLPPSLAQNKSRHWPAMAATQSAQPSDKPNHGLQWLLRFTPSSASPENEVHRRAQSACQKHTRKRT